jgi:hypothetical protein
MRTLGALWCPLVVFLVSDGARWCPLAMHSWCSSYLYPIKAPVPACFQVIRVGISICTPFPPGTTLTSADAHARQIPSQLGNRQAPPTRLPFWYVICGKLLSRVAGR